jgi:hypothetical protein
VARESKLFSKGRIRFRQTAKTIERTHVPKRNHHGHRKPKTPPLPKNSLPIATTPIPVPKKKNSRKIQLTLAKSCSKEREGFPAPDPRGGRRSGMVPCSAGSASVGVWGADGARSPSPSLLELPWYWSKRVLPHNEGTRGALLCSAPLDSAHRHHAHPEPAH